jgi:hypothetical protein
MRGRAAREETSAAGGGARSVLIVAWEYPGYHSRQGTALSRRVGQIARGFARANWRVSVVHRLQRPDDPARDREVKDPVTPDVSINRRALAGSQANVELGRSGRAALRKATTAWHALHCGDRSGLWAGAVEELAKRGGLFPHSLVIGCFTPRGPLRAAAKLHRLWRVPWIADLQDPWWEGSSPPLRRIVARWMRRTLRSAASVFQVSPEWAAQDAAVLHRDVEVLRHAVPDLGEPAARAGSREARAAFIIVYAGSLNEDCQDLNPFMDALKLLRDRPGMSRRVIVRVAGSDAVWRKFLDAASARGITDSLEHLGWLTDAQLRDAMIAADALLLIPWFPEWRQGVPSKMYEYIAFATPTLVAGADSGGISQLLMEWGHPPVVAARAPEIVEAIRLAAGGDASRLVDRARCGVTPLSESELGAKYVERAESIVGRFGATVIGDAPGDRA